MAESDSKGETAGEGTPSAAVAAVAVKPAGVPARKSAKDYQFRGEGTSWWQSYQWRMGRSVSRLLSVLLFRLRVGGLHHIPKAGPTLLVTNHQSFLDPWLIGIAPRRQVHYMARDTLFKGGFLQWLMECLNAYPIKRGQADRAAIATTAQRLDQGFLVNIFPEGTRSEDGTIGAIAPGIALILNRCKSDVVIIPVVIDGAYQAWPRNKKFPSPHAIRIEHGKPILPAEWRGLKPDQLALRIRTELVKLQAEMNSPHADESRRKLDAVMSESTAAAGTRRG